jgi:hypothetical protein
MAQVFTLEPTAPPRTGVTYAPFPEAPARPTTTVLPAEWTVVDDVRVSGDVIDQAIVGPNGVFAVQFDADLRPAAVRDHGVIRNGVCVKEPVKKALRSAFALRALLAESHPNIHPYPVLVTETPGNGTRMGRLLVVRPGRLAEVVWSHVSRPLTRSERAEILTVIFG